MEYHRRRAVRALLQRRKAGRDDGVLRRNRQKVRRHREVERRLVAEVVADADRGHRHPAEAGHVRVFEPIVDVLRQDRLCRDAPNGDDGVVRMNKVVRRDRGGKRRLEGGQHVVVALDLAAFVGADAGHRGRRGAEPIPVLVADRIVDSFRQRDRLVSRVHHCRHGLAGVRRCVVHHALGVGRAERVPVEVERVADAAVPPGVGRGRPRDVCARVGNRPVHAVRAALDDPVRRRTRGNRVVRGGEVVGDRLRGIGKPHRKDNPSAFRRRIQRNVGHPEHLCASTVVEQVRQALVCIVERSVTRKPVLDIAGCLADGEVGRHGAVRHNRERAVHPLPLPVVESKLAQLKATISTVRLWEILLSTR